MKLRNILGNYFMTGAVTLGVATLGLSGFTCSQNADLPGFFKDAEMGRTKNSLSTVIAGITAQKMHPNAKIDLEIKKNLWPDAYLTGDATRETIDTEVTLALTSSRFQATGNSYSNLSGTVEKSELDWDVKQKDSVTYTIDRFGWKFNNTLQLDVQNGKISGTLDRAPGWDWDIDGTYDSDGNVKINVYCPLTTDFSLEGKITKN